MVRRMITRRDDKASLARQISMIVLKLNAPQNPHLVIHRRPLRSGYEKHSVTLIIRRAKYIES